eukprot:5198811-Alexandrium_andersonii.AAC.1
MVSRPRFCPRCAERRSKGGGDPEGRDGALGKSAGLDGAPGASQTQTQGFKGSAPALALHVD